MFDELTPEREKYLIEQAAQYIIEHDFEDYAKVIIEGTAPFGYIVGQLGYIMTYPIAVAFFDRTGSDFVNMLGFNYKLNANRILERIEVLKEEKKHLKEKQREKAGLKGNRKGWFSRLFSRLPFKRGLN